MAFGLKQMKEGERTCARCPKPKLSHKLDVMNLSVSCTEPCFFLLKTFTVQTYIIITKFCGKLKMYGTHKKIAFDNVNYKDYCTNCIIHVHI